ncbi:MAG: ATP-binding cassette domain-containing protein [Planctomycetes bacterium]|nr:ATP-binding cassette domain-containing protein [Planctomycetota bacterium]
MSALRCSHLSFNWPDGTSVFSDLTLSFPTNRTALIGNNGAGKSTFLQLMAGRLRPVSGFVAVDGDIAYLPQRLTAATTTSIASLLGIEATLAAIRAVDNGNADPATLDLIGDDWDIEERAIAELTRMGLSAHLFIDGPILEKKIGNLSGGEATRIALAGIMLRRPAITLLDEPTNNLDASARRWLYGAVRDWRGTLLVVSHDRELLELMDNIAELRSGEVRFFGGNYSHYLKQRETERQAALRSLHNAEAALRQEKKQRVRGQTKAAGSASQGRKQMAQSRFPKAVINLRRERAEALMGTKRAERESRIAEATDAMRSAKENAREEESIAIDMPETTVPAGRSVLEMVFEGKRYHVTGPERIVLTGDNGSGKTTLLRALMGKTAIPGMQVKSIISPVGFMPQNLNIFDEKTGSIDNLRQLVPDIGINRAHAALARYLLRGDKVNQPVASLSGGERLRLALACLLSPEPSPRLLLLDEPTNNLDIASMDILASALACYHGALIIVCHDRRFLESLQVAREWRLEDLRLIQDIEYFSQ